MIKINLLPPEYQIKKAKKLQMPDIEFLPVLGWVAGGLVLLQAILVIFILYEKLTVKNMDARLAKLAPIKSEAEQLKKQIAIANKKVAAVDDLTLKRFLWAKKLSQLSDAVIPGVWLEGLSVEKGTSQAQTPPLTTGKSPAKPYGEEKAKYILVLKGHAIGVGTDDKTAIVGKFMKSLKDNKEFFEDFEDVELCSMQKRNVKDIDIADFTLNCYFKEKEGLF